MKRFITLGLLAFFVLISPAVADDAEAYTIVLDHLTSIDHFSESPVLFVVGFDTTKSMSVEFDRAKRITQLILSRYGAPGDSVFVFGFANQPKVLTATSKPKEIPTNAPDKTIATLGEAIMSLGRSPDFGTVFGRAKLFALEQIKKFGAHHNVVVLLFTDNNSELDMGVDERKHLKAIESELKMTSETFPLKSVGVSKLWMTLYANDFPDSTRLKAPDGQDTTGIPRLAWAASRMGKQTLSFTSPSHTRVTRLPFDVAVQFLGPTQPQQAQLTIDGKSAQTASFDEGRAHWQIDSLSAGSHVLFAQAILPDGKVRTAELPITIDLGAAASQGSSGSSSTPMDPLSSSPEASATSIPNETATPIPDATPSELPAEETSIAPFIILGLLFLAGTVAYILSTKPARIRIIGPRSEESYLLRKGQTLRLGGSPRVENELVFADSALLETLAVVSGSGFGKARVTPSPLRDGTVEIETDEGIFVTDSGEDLLTSMAVTFTTPRNLKEIYTILCDDSKNSSAQESHFAGSSGSDDSETSGDWRS